MLESVIFIVATAGIIYVSRASLRVPGSHGFYRFFAWESLLVLFLLNVRHWIKNPLSAHQIISWLLLLISLWLVVHGAYLLDRRGKPDVRRNDAPMLKMEKTTVLLTDGLYSYIRHPLYSSLLFLGWGIFFKRPSWPGTALALIASIFLILTARSEEKENSRYFGPVYHDYMKQSKMFIPFLL